MKKSPKQQRHRIQSAQELINAMQANRANNLDASNLDLRNITLDSTSFNNIDFTGANMNGANMSECTFIECIFDEACLIDTCLCESSFENCTFLNARFGATDICYGTIMSCVFSGSTALSLNFLELSTLSSCRLIHGDTNIIFSKAPVVLNGLLNAPVAIIGESLIIGQKIIPLSAMPPSLTQFVFHQLIASEAKATPP